MEKVTLRATQQAQLLGVVLHAWKACMAHCNVRAGGLCENQ